MKIAIVTDSLTNLREEDLQKYPFIYYAHLNVVVDDKSYIDLKEITNDQLFRFIDEGASYSSSLPSPEVFVTLYEKLLAEYDAIISLHCTENVSGTVNSARIARDTIEGAKEKITVIDTNTASIGVENIVIKVCELLEQGKSLDELLEVIEYYRTHGQLYLTINDLTTLVRTGRISKTASRIGNLLHIKPIIGFKDAKLEVMSKVRTKKRLLKWMLEKLRHDIEQSGKQVVRITHVNSIDLATELKHALEICGDKVDVFISNEISSVMAIHFGRGGVGASWMPANYSV
ncbi:DegV family protein [Terribacillus saccharophilus]|jgi:DegV family protein with EDD domain|uniref:6-phosphogluconate dehydratase n=1 Tax=Terribacillus saccharophilus TaxID=361277 RepID=A0ABX4GYA2_9BACI|nr:DegV family protein [Terribacillus saccharophilus]PAD35856.1 6-phosphogluconate dehydratase [Terribacillus saccharophilus]PAD96282.1 6-phosphogluconate dehydratase [Terribacillus saccharophilus]PAD99857.1 6-phosphogluconate dehydratase [Terribacillus saccharophilus]